jgi:2-polyprenyl-6-methoxyphenol hydroxylase-like FAD-dependent oxidoreductase
MRQTDVLIAGAGPTGLVLALCLTKQGVSVRIIDAAPGPGTTSRAMAVQARTLELYRQLDLADAVIAAGHKNPSISLWARGTRRAQVGFGTVGEALTPYPFVLIFPQDQHERLLLDRLQAVGVTVERDTELLDFEDHGDRVGVRFRHKDGTENTCDAQYLAGCDGARSRVRHVLGAGFEGGTYQQVFYVADVDVTGPAAGEGVNVALDTDDFVALFAYGHGNQHRLIGTVREDRVDDIGALTFEDVSHHAIDNLQLDVRAVNWFSTYRVHHRVTDRFRSGRVFLLGDAAHVHSPAGGQGMNTGIADAINLAWKLRMVLRGEARDALLDTYATERAAFAHQLVNTTDRIFNFITADGSFADFVRTRVAPIFASAAFSVEHVREFMFRLISQTMLSYHDSALSAGSAGKVRGGDRLPWVGLHGVDNHAPLGAIAWQVHVYGAPADALRAWCDQRGVPLHAFDWQSSYAEAGLARDAAYLVRPDGYVALADAGGSADAMERHWAALAT